MTKKTIEVHYSYREYREHPLSVPTSVDVEEIGEDEARELLETYGGLTFSEDEEFQFESAGEV